MSSARKDLPAVGDTLVLNCNEEEAGYVALQYISGSAGTVVLEGILSDAAADNVDANWLPITMAKNDDTAITSLAAAGIGRAINVYSKVRARKTVGVASCIVVLSIQSF